MFDLTIKLDDKPGTLAELGEVLGRAKISVEGGGVFVTGGYGVAHFLFEDGDAATLALEAAGVHVESCQRVLLQKLRQDEPGQLGKLARLMAQANVNIEVMYSDHQNQLVLVVDNVEAGQRVSEAWKQDTKVS